MAIIYSYPTVTPESGDLIVGTDITGKVTKNFTVGSIVSTEIPTYITGITNSIPLFTGANTIGDSIISQNVNADKISISGDFDVSGDVSSIGVISGKVSVKDGGGGLVFNINGTQEEASDLDAEYIASEDAFRFSSTQKIISDTPLDLTGGFTVLHEVYIEDNTVNGRIISNSLGFSPASGGFFTSYSSNNATSSDRRLVIEAGANSFVSENLDASTLNSWIKVAFSVSSSGTATMYIDGTLVPITGTDLVLPDSTNPVVLGNLYNTNTSAYDRGMNGKMKRASIFLSSFTQAEVVSWNDETITQTPAFTVDFSETTGSEIKGLYWLESGANKYRKIVKEGALITEVYRSSGWEKYSDNTSSTTNLSKANSPLATPIGTATDGWGSGAVKAHLQPITAGDFEYINSGVNLSGVVGEAFHGFSCFREWVVQVPQDHHSAVCYNTITGEVKEIDLSAYVRANPSPGNNGRDKFNGSTTTHGGKYLWLCPSWTTHLVKIDTTTFTIVQDWLVNSSNDDAYNGIVATRKYIWLVTHSKEDLPRLNIETGVMTILPLPEPNPGDFNYGNGANNRSFLGGSDNGDGTIWLHPRRSKYIVKIHEESGDIIHTSKNPFADDPTSPYGPAWGNFHGGTNLDGKIWFGPWGQEKVSCYDIGLDSWTTTSVSLTGTAQWSFASVTDGRFVYFPPYKAREIVKIDTLDNSVHIIDATAMVNAFIAGSSRTLTDGFAGGSLFMNGCIWFSSSLDSAILKMPLKELGDLSLVTQEDVKAKGTVISNEGEFYFGDNLRFKRVGNNIEIQLDSGSGFVTVKTL